MNVAKIRTWMNPFTNWPLYIAPTPGINPRIAAKPGCPVPVGAAAGPYPGGGGGGTFAPRGGIVSSIRAARHSSQYTTPRTSRAQLLHNPLPHVRQYADAATSGCFTQVLIFASSAVQDRIAFVQRDQNTVVIVPAVVLVLLLFGLAIGVVLLLVPWRIFLFFLLIATATGIAAGIGHALQIANARLDLVDQPNVLVVLHHLRLAVVVRASDAFGRQVPRPNPGHAHDHGYGEERHRTRHCKSWGPQWREMRGKPHSHPIPQWRLTGLGFARRLGDPRSRYQDVVNQVARRLDLVQGLEPLQPRFR